MSLSFSAAKASITKLEVDKHTEDDGTKVPAVALKLQVKVSADILAEFHPSLRSALFKKEGRVRFKSMKEVGWEGTRRGCDLAIRPGPDMKPAVQLHDVTLRDFKLKPLEEGAQEFVALRFVADVENPTASIGQILDYVKEEAWIDIQGGGELDLGPPSARTEIEGIDAPVAAAPEPGSSRAEIVIAKAMATSGAVVAVRRLQASRKGVKQKLASYHDDVLRAAIAAENEDANPRALFIAMLDGELKRRAGTHPKGSA